MLLWRRRLYRHAAYDVVVDEPSGSSWILGFAIAGAAVHHLPRTRSGAPPRVLFLEFLSPSVFAGRAGSDR
jgi:hypothetical protein